MKTDDRDPDRDGRTNDRKATATCAHCRYEYPAAAPRCTICGYPWPWMDSGQEREKDPPKPSGPAEDAE